MTYGLKGTSRVLAIVAASLAPLVLAPGPAAAVLLTFDAALSGANEVPSNASTATGQADLVIDTTTRLFDFTMTVDGITTADLAPAGGNESSFHIHEAPAGVNGPIVVDLGFLAAAVPTATGFTADINDALFGGTQGEIVSDPAANVAALLAGDMYVNVHTLDFPAGEIRGQLRQVAQQVSEPAGTLLIVTGAIALWMLAFLRRARRTLA